MHKSKLFTNIIYDASLVEVRWDAQSSHLGFPWWPLRHFSIEHNFENLWSKAANHLSNVGKKTF